MRTSGHGYVVKLCALTVVGGLGKLNETFDLRLKLVALSEKEGRFVTWVEN